MSSAPVRRELLLEAARTSFIAHGLGASMRQIATTAGVDPALLYYHFTSKQDLFEAAVVEPLDTLAKDLLEAGERVVGATPEAKVAAASDGIAEILRGMVSAAPLIATALFSDQHYGERLYAERVAPLFSRMAEACDLAFTDWDAAGLDWAVYVAGLFGLCFGIAMDARLRGRPLVADDVSDAVARFALRGVGADVPSAAAG